MREVTGRQRVITFSHFRFYNWEACGYNRDCAGD